MEAINSPPPVATSSFLTPLLISMLGIVATSMAIIVYHLVLVKYCLRRQENSSESSQLVPDPRPPTGVEPKILETIPILAYSTKKGYLFRVDQTECVVCLGELEDEDIVRLLPNCKHSFHVPCIDQWFMARDSCPVCRSPIVAPITQVPPLHAHVDQTDSVELPPQDHDQRAHIGGNHPQGPQTCGLLRHCASMALPTEKRSRNLVTGLKRSLSMDQSDHVAIDIQRESGSECSSTKADILRDRLSRARSIRHLDRVSSKLLRSFSRLTMGQGSATTEILLPY
ncbi:putative RING-H2 finger protein ATL53 [Cornus florida]|uniref:putative RING-H2 finger protein ATL53 n=1 Tax=Cornus florida TaxID=4283 RepID=UPI002896A236|nr:putative RING-H2 finger protein ATL53 [Cornus florida]